MTHPECREYIDSGSSRCVRCDVRAWHHPVERECIELRRIAYSFDPDAHAFSMHLHLALHIRQRGDEVPEWLLGRLRGYKRRNADQRHALWERTLTRSVLAQSMRNRLSAERCRWTNVPEVLRGLR